MIPFHSPFSFFLPNVISFTTSISKVKFNRSAKSSRISTQKPTNFCVEFEPFGPRIIANPSASSVGHHRSYWAWHKVVPRQEQTVDALKAIENIDLQWLWLFSMFDFGFLAFLFRNLWRNSVESPIDWEDSLTNTRSNRPRKGSCWSNKVAHSTLCTPSAARSTTSSETSVRKPFSSNLIFPVMPFASN